MKSLRTTRAILAQAAALALLLAFMAAPLAAQAKKKQQGPRSMGVLQWTAPNAAPTLVPITLWINGAYQDASIYMASPVPMALDSGIVYEAYKHGVSQGLFEIKEPKQRKGNWVATGRWTSHAAEVAEQKRAEKIEASVDEGRPVLRRRPEQPAASNPGAQPGSAVPQPDGTASPGLENPPETSDRPVLKRGKPSGEDTEAAPPATRAKASVPPPPPQSGPKVTTPEKELVAISDASNTTSHDWSYPYTADEAKNWETKMVQVAEHEIAVAQRAPAKAALPQLTEHHFEAFDLDQDNEPLFVITGRLAPGAPGANTAPPPDTYVTVVARLDIDNNIRKIFSSVTTSDRLDVVGRLQLIDAVDADGDGHAELLFRRIGTYGRSFQLYRGGADRLWKLYDSGRE